MIPLLQAHVKTKMPLPFSRIESGTVRFVDEEVVDAIITDSLYQIHVEYRDTALSAQTIGFDA